MCISSSDEPSSDEDSGESKSDSASELARKSFWSGGNFLRSFLSSTTRDHLCLSLQLVVILDLISGWLQGFRPDWSGWTSAITPGFFFIRPFFPIFFGFFKLISVISSNTRLAIFARKSTAEIVWLMF